MELLELAKRVKRGVRLLDKKVPNWRAVLRRHEGQYDFADGDHCVLGTLEHFSGRMRVLRERGLDPDRTKNAYVVAAARLGIWNEADRTTDDSTPAQCGFDAVDLEATRDADRNVLDALWRAEFSK